MKTAKLGVLGVSYHFLSRVLSPLLKSELIQVYGIASRDSKRAKEAAERYGIPKYYPSYEDLLRDSEIDVVYIPLPNHLHAEWIRKSADYGKHILCEKPLALNAPEAKEAVNYAKGKGVKIMEAFMYRFHPQWQKALELVQFKVIGRVNSMHSFYGYLNLDPKNIRNIREVGGGAIYDIGCYVVSSARFLLQAEPRRVLNIIEFDSNFQTDILVNGILDFGGVRSLFTVGTQTFPYQRVEVYGTNAVLTVEIPFNMYADVPARVTVRTNVGTRCIDLGPADQYLLQFEAFAKAIRDGLEAPTPPEDAINNMKVLDALFKSAQTGQWENV